MSQGYLNSPCPICDENYIKTADPNGLMSEIDCARCGKYKIGRRLLDDRPWYDVRHLVSAWVRRENKNGITPIVGKGASIPEASDPEWWEKQFRSMGFPETTNEKLDALLLAYAEELSGSYGKTIEIDPALISAIAAKNIDEIRGLTDLLVEMKYLSEKENSFGGAARIISAQGWLRVDEMRKVYVSSNAAFIAMWFSEHTRKYREVVTAAVEYCGFRPIIVDQEEYSGFIMDQVISLLKQAKFVIADFTCRREEVNNGEVKNGVRGGVYWESGMAYGLGKPLIHTCEDNPESRERIHFDVDQYNTIYWNQNDLGTNIRPIEEANINPIFAEKLVARIIVRAYAD
jgi:nucleoside 2-deoxyribosyltransferase